MSVDEDAGDVLEYLYLKQETPVDASEIFAASDLSHDAVRDALDRLEDKLLVEVGVKPEGGGYEDVSLTAEGLDTIEDEGAFIEAFGTPLDLNRIAREWGSD